MAGPARPASTPLEAALLDFQRAPGRHAVARREPIALFAAIREVLQLAAAGRLADSAAPPDAALQVAALMFIRSALFQPSADHYVLLGLDRSAEPAAVKERYRQVMRVIHPDFAAGGESRWPTDAASRVNNAYEVLSDPDRRLAYDEALAGGAAAASASVASSAATPAPPRAARRSVHTARVARADPPDRRNTLKWAVAGSGAAAAAVLLTSVLLGGRQDEVHLVQRQTAPVAAARPSAPASAPAALAVAAVVPAEVPKTATAPPPPAPVQLAAAVLKLQASLSLVPVPAQPVPARSVGPDQPRAAGVPTAPSVEPPRSAPAAEAVAAQVAATPAPAPVSPPAMVAAPAL
ncbi:MAG TPA: J domain-containing protein, partial [Ramlibacter sp.]|nr:J domain-containing protein [Ramlibacter sp.]